MSVHDTGSSLQQTVAVYADTAEAIVTPTALTAIAVVLFYLVPTFRRIGAYLIDRERSSLPSSTQAISIRKGQVSAYGAGIPDREIGRGGDALLDIVVDIDVGPAAPASAIADLLAALDLTFRDYCREQELPFEGLDLIESGVGSFWARLRPRRRAGADPQRYDRGSYRIAIASFVLSLSQVLNGPPSQDEIQDAVRRGVESAIAHRAGDVTISGGGQTCIYPTPAARGSQPRATMQSLSVEIETVGDSPFARTSLSSEPLPVQDMRALGPPLWNGHRYQVFTRVIVGEGGRPIALQVRDAVEFEAGADDSG